jgi:membrane protein
LVARLKALAERLSRPLPARVLLKFAADDGPSHAIVIGWNGLFSLFPITLALAAITGFVLGRLGLESISLTNLVVSVIPNDANAQAEVLAGLNGIEQNTKALAVVALGGFLWSAWALFGAMEQAFDQAFQCPRRDFLRQKVMSLAMMCIWSVLALLAVGTSALLPILSSLPNVPEELHKGAALEVYQIVFGAAAGFALFATLYLVVPNRPLRLGQVLPGALLAGLGFELLSQVFPLYIRFNQGINRYGAAFALLFVLMFFFYCLGLLTVLGAELIAVRAGVGQEDRATLSEA